MQLLYLASLVQCAVRIFHFGPSGVRALPLAAGTNEGGHYFHNKIITCQSSEYNPNEPEYNPNKPEYNPNEPEYNPAEHQYNPAEHQYNPP